MSALTITALILLIITPSLGRSLERKLILERVEVPICHPDYRICSCLWQKVDRDRSSLNLNVTLLTDETEATNNEEYMEIKVKKYANGEYKDTALYYKRNFCDFMNRELKSFIDLNDPTIKDYFLTCPLKKGDYFVRNFTNDAVSIGSFSAFPDWKFCLTVTTGYRDVIISVANIFLSIEQR